MMKILLSILILISISFSEESKDRFSHSLHVVKEELECADCHGTVLKSNNLDSIQIISKGACEDCHEDLNYNPSITYTLTDTGFPIVFTLPPEKLKLSHALHGEKGVACTDCHGKPGGKPSAGLRQDNMQACMDCHEQKADNSCLACHYEALQPESHQALNWLRRSAHGLQAGINQQECQLCHPGEQSCTSCHMGADGKRIHETDYRHTHGTDVIFKQSDCSVCHQPVNFFCGDCHENLGNW
jgi:predicted CXXCH cytochrome family protein